MKPIKFKKEERTMFKRFWNKLIEANCPHNIIWETWGWTIELPIKE
jgi:hypothetical protein